MKSWWDGLPERLVVTGLDPMIANALRQDFREFVITFRGEIQKLPYPMQRQVWKLFHRVFLGGKVSGV